MLMGHDMWRKPVTLHGKFVTLEPLSEAHIPGLVEAGKNESIWKYMLYANLTSDEAMTAWVRDLLMRQESGTDLPFTVFDNKSGNVAGATRYLEMRPAHRSLEIGGTWYGLAYQGTVVNPECKNLLLKHAFETLGCIRVQFKADSLNVRSVGAIERLGAVKEGTLRNHYIMQDGRFRDSVYFSILDREWPEVKRGLEDRLKGFASTGY
jgi:N-acetyltransferase